MKNLLHLIFLMIPCSLLAQATEYGNFKISGTDIIYQKVFDQTGITVEKLQAFLKTVSDVSNVTVTDGVVSADLNDLTVDYKKFQFTQVATPPIIQTGKYSGKVNIDVKQDKYRVTITSIQMTGEIGYKKIPNPESLTNYATINSGTALSRDWCKPNTLGLLDKAFTDRFTYQEQEDSADW